MLGDGVRVGGVALSPCDQVHADFFTFYFKQ